MGTSDMSHLVKYDVLRPVKTRNNLLRLLESVCIRHVSHMAVNAEHLSKPLIEASGTFQNPWPTWEVRSFL